MSHAENAELQAEVKPEDIVVTPEMIEAGEAILYGFNTETASEDYWAEKIFKAMACVQRESVD